MNFLIQRIKKISGLLFAAALVIIFAVWMLLDPAPQHIEDTNGAENYRLQQITDGDIIAAKMGSRGGVSTAKTHLDIAGFGISGGKKYSSKKFTGVYKLYSATLMKNSDILIDLSDFKIKGGNFAFCIVFDGKIIGEITPDESGISTFAYQNVSKSGDLEYIIAGESAEFSFITPTEW